MEETVQIITPADKFNHCKHRSPEEESRIIKRCSCQGGDYVEKGYFCHKRQIFKLGTQICEICELFESK